MECIVSQEKTEAIVLRGVDFSESSRIVTFLTPARGRMACIAKGARRKNSGLGPVLDTLNRVEVVYYWKEARQVQILAEATLLDGFQGLKTDLERNAYAGFPLELVCHVAHENEPSRELFAAFADGLASLAAWRGDVRTHACWQVLRLLRAAGFEPVLELCAHCGNAVGATPGFTFSGGVACPQCQADRRLSAAAYAAMLALQQAPTACPSATAPKEVFVVLWHYAAHQLEMAFRSVRVIEEMVR